MKPVTAGASAVSAVKAGTDLTCGGEYRSLLDEVKAGQELYAVDDDLQQANLNQNKATLANAQHIAPAIPLNNSAVEIAATATNVLGVSAATIVKPAIPPSPITTPACCTLPSG